MRRAAAAMSTLAELTDRMDPRPGGRCLVAVSGGADSVALLGMMRILRDRGEADPLAVHVNHGLRGEASDGDERFVADLCRAWDLPLRISRLTLERTDENTAREGRYEAFFRIMEEERISTLVLAHQLNDQAETWMMRLLRGAGPEGLGGMSAREERNGKILLRPLLGIFGAELREALRAERISWREDESNGDRRYFRNRIRLDLMPALEEMAPGASSRIARTAAATALENRAMEQAAEKLLAESERPGGLAAAPLAAAPEALRRRALRRWWRQRGPALAERNLSYDQTERLSGLVNAPAGTIINLPGGWRARREKTFLRLLEPGNRTKNNRPERGQRRAYNQRGRKTVSGSDENPGDQGGDCRQGE